MNEIVIDSNQKWEFRRSSKEVGIDVSCHLRSKIIISGIRNKLQENTYLKMNIRSTILVKKPC